VSRCSWHQAWSRRAVCRFAVWTSVETWILLLFLSSGTQIGIITTY
jgi:hypothetical protein